MNDLDDFRRRTSQEEEQPGHYVVREYHPDSLPPGPAEYGLYFMCPCGCGQPGYLPLIPPGRTKSGDHTWHWDGNKSTPTLEPSIRRTHGCKFHGYLRQGVWSSAGDGAPVAGNCYKGSPTQETPVMAPPQTADVPAAPVPTDLPPAATSDPVNDLPKLDHPPIGYAKTGRLGFFEGLLHELYAAAHPGQTQQAWVLVHGQQRSNPLAPIPPPAGQTQPPASVTSDTPPVHRE